jgi:hypothetical protein
VGEVGEIDSGGGSVWVSFCETGGFASPSLNLTPHRELQYRFLQPHMKTLSVLSIHINEASS